MQTAEWVILWSLGPYSKQHRAMCIVVVLQKHETLHQLTFVPLALEWNSHGTLKRSWLIYITQSLGWVVWSSELISLDSGGMQAFQRTLRRDKHLWTERKSIPSPTYYTILGLNNIYIMRIFPITKWGPDHLLPCFLAKFALVHLVYYLF